MRGAERDIINAVGKNVRAIIKWAPLGIVPAMAFGSGVVLVLANLFYHDLQRSVLHRILFLKKHFPCQLCQLFWAARSLVVTEQF